MSKFARQIETARRLIAKNGQSMTLYRLTTEAPYDPLAPSALALAISQQCPISGVVLPASNGTIEAFDARILADPDLLKNFRFVILAGSGTTFKPRPQDMLSTAEGPYRILGSTPLDPAGDGPIIFNVGCTLDISFVLP